MSSYLRGSPNYVWSTTSILGKGATATVHQGVNKVNGEPVAVKTFNHISTLRPLDVQLREFEVLRKVKHENIVKLLAIEEEQDSRGKVIVMELCTGGSLFNILEDPENTYGLEEKEFLLVLKHLFAGMKHLRENELVHRDLKPGNIMKFIRDDGSTVYKLTDFGAARELQDGQHFQSLYGTEEYLHPDMYERAVLRKHVNKSFGATIDLWSIGVTLFHVATGSLPFKPYGGRKNKETMYHITTKKESGVISGIQTKENGPIEWRRELPNSCQLSAGLKKIITPLLAGLLEADSRKIWSFEKFFSEVSTVLSREAINIFHVNRAELIKVYIHPDEIYMNLQEYITEQTGMGQTSQIILYETTLLNDIVRENTRACGYPKTTEEEPIFLFNKENNNITIDPRRDIPKFNDFPNVVVVENDASQAKVACSVGHICKRLIEKFSLACKLIWDTIDKFTKYIYEELRLLNTDTMHLKEKYTLTNKNAEIIEFSQSISKYKTGNFKSKLGKISMEFLRDSVVGVQNLHKTHCIENNLKSQWENISRDLKCPHKNKAPARAKTMVENLRDSWQNLVRDRATRSLSYNDEQFHILERIKITQTIKRILELLDKEVVPLYAQLAENFGDWYKMAQNIQLKADILKADVFKYDERLEDFSSEMFISNSVYMDHIKNNTQAKSVLPKDIKSNNQKDKLKNVLMDFKKESKDFKEIMDENKNLVNQLKEFKLFADNPLA
ncbi:unnamed protein product [Brassicogethes aeneus]|uniref:Protein kinase domain-containing protein n=1 Tax=Brassicogethes aeneus TaxID=1431903 RepID=A0A9P0AVQ2_BRAAE|nr:unnamed protein product [Brassicogethes aeneus]